MDFTDEPCQLLLSHQGPSVISLTVWATRSDGQVSMDICVSVPRGSSDVVHMTPTAPFQPADLLRMMQVFSQLVLDSVAPFPPES